METFNGFQYLLVHCFYYYLLAAVVQFLRKLCVPLDKEQNRKNPISIPIWLWVISLNWYILIQIIYFGLIESDTPSFTLSWCSIQFDGHKRSNCFYYETTTAAMAFVIPAVYGMRLWGFYFRRNGGRFSNPISQHGKMCAVSLDYNSINWQMAFQVSIKLDETEKRTRPNKQYIQFQIKHTTRARILGELKSTQRTTHAAFHAAFFPRCALLIYSNEKGEKMLEEQKKNDNNFYYPNIDIV